MQGTTATPLLQFTLIKVCHLQTSKTSIIHTLIILKSVERLRGSKLDSTQEFKYMRTRWEDMAVRNYFGISKLWLLYSLTVLVPYATS